MNKLRRNQPACLEAVGVPASKHCKRLHSATEQDDKTRHEMLLSSMAAMTEILHLPPNCRDLQLLLRNPSNRRQGNLYRFRAVVATALSLQAPVELPIGSIVVPFLGLPSRILSI